MDNEPLAARNGQSDLRSRLQMQSDQLQHQRFYSHEPEVQQPVSMVDTGSEVQSDTAELTSETDREILQTDTESGIQSENEPEIQSDETEPDDQPDLMTRPPEPELQTRPVSWKLDSQHELHFNAQPRVQPAETPRESNSKPATQSETQPEKLSVDNSEVDFVNQAGKQMEGRTMLPSKAQLEAEAPEAEDQPDDQPEVKPEAAQNKDEPNFQSQLQPEAAHDVEKPDVQLKTQPEVELGEQPILRSGTKSQPEAKPKVEPEMHTKVQSSEVQPEVKSMDYQKVKQKADVQSEAETEEFPKAAQPEAGEPPGFLAVNEMRPETGPGAQPEPKFVAQSQGGPNSQSNVEIGIQLPHQSDLLLHRSEGWRHDTIILPASKFIRNSQSVGRKPQFSFSSLKLPAATSRNGSVLSLPYPIEQCGAQMQRTFPGQIGRFYVTNAYCYAYICNRMSIEIAAESMGFEKRSFLGEVRPPDSEQQQQQPGQEEQPVASRKSLERRIDDLEQDLARDPRLTLMIVKPSRMNWNKLGNCLIFERCHPHRHYIADKWQMFLVLRRSSTLRHLQLSTASGKRFDYNNFILYTANPGYYQRELLKYLDSHPGTYILKRTNYSQGIGIRIYHAERPNTVDRLRHCAGNRASLNQFVLQKYIERPLLVDKRKFDLRVYMMLLSCKRPAAGTGSGFECSYFAFCYPGYVKLSCYPYSKLSRDMHVHLTNQFVQKQRWSLYTRVKEATTWFPDELNAYLNRRGRTEADWCKNKLYSRIRAIVGYVAAAFRPHLESNASPASVFRLYGPDFIIDEDLNVWLLEVNTFPSYSKNTAALSGSIRNMWREAVTVATETTLRYRNRLPVNGLTTVRNFRLAYSSEDPGLLGELVKESFA